LARMARSSAGAMSSFVAAGYANSVPLSAVDLCAVVVRAPGLGAAARLGSPWASDQPRSNRKIERGRRGRRVNGSLAPSRVGGYMSIAAAGRGTLTPWRQGVAWAGGCTAGARVATVFARPAELRLGRCAGPALRNPPPGQPAVPGEHQLRVGIRRTVEFTATATPAVPQTWVCVKRELCRVQLVERVVGETHGQPPAFHHATGRPGNGNCNDHASHVGLRMQEPCRRIWSAGRW